MCLGAVSLWCVSPHPNNRARLHPCTAAPPVQSPRAMVRDERRRGGRAHGHARGAAGTRAAGGGKRRSRAVCFLFSHIVCFIASQNLTAKQTTHQTTPLLVHTPDDPAQAAQAAPPAQPHTQQTLGPRAGTARGELKRRNERPAASREALPRGLLPPPKSPLPSPPTQHQSSSLPPRRPRSHDQPASAITRPTQPSNTRDCTRQ